MAEEAPCRRSTRLIGCSPTNSAPCSVVWQRASRRVAMTPVSSVRNIVLRVGRPVLAVVGGAAQLEFKDSESEVWRTRLQASSAQLQRAAGAVGRINVTDRPDVPYVGTGWLVEKDAIVTNRHVARGIRPEGPRRFHVQERAAAQADQVCRSISSKKPAGLTNSRSRSSRSSTSKTTTGRTSRCCAWASRGDRRSPRRSRSPRRRRTPTQQVAVMGYPGRDSRAPDAQLVQSIFGDVFDKKRLAPGQLTEAKADVLLHDCSTLGGNSGSVVLDLATGQAVGLHFAGRFLETNYAVPAAVVAERLERVRHPKPGKAVEPSATRSAIPPAVVDADTGRGTPDSYEVYRRRRAGRLRRAHRVRPAFHRRRRAPAGREQHGRRPRRSPGTAARNRSSSTSTSRW